LIEPETPGFSAQKLCNLSELQEDQSVKKEIVRFSTGICTEIVEMLISFLFSQGSDICCCDYDRGSQRQAYPSINPWITFCYPELSLTSDQIKFYHPGREDEHGNWILTLAQIGNPAYEPEKERHS
jgi:hypothetical protein